MVLAVIAEVHPGGGVVRAEPLFAVSLGAAAGSFDDDRARRIGVIGAIVVVICVSGAVVGAGRERPANDRTGGKSAQRSASAAAMMPAAVATMPARLRRRRRERDRSGQSNGSECQFRSHCNISVGCLAINVARAMRVPDLTDMQHFDA